MIRMFEQHAVRKQTELDGLWDFQPVKEHGLPEKYDDKILVPSCWETRPGYENYRGYAAYKKTIKLDEACDLRFVFKGVSHTADVYFDKQHIAHHYNAYTEFSAVVCAAQAGEHTLEVLVDNTFGEHSALHIANDYYTYGGITRPALVEYIKGAAFIEYMHFTPHKDAGKWTADVEVMISGTDSDDHTLELDFYLDGKKISLPDVGVILFSGGSQKVSFTLSFADNDIKEWDVLKPSLYILSTTISENGAVVDDKAERVGFREVKTEGDKILLNGKEIFIKGFNRHEDYQGVGCAIPVQMGESDLQLMLDMGANTVRTCHYPNDERFLDLCDEHGILVWEEGHARGLSIEDMRNPNFDKQSADCIDEMVTSHFNHPSIIIWGILNECESSTEEGKAKYEMQFSQIKDLDNSRPRTFATCKHFTDISFDLVDIVSINIYFGWYGTETTLEEIGQSFKEYLEWIDTTPGKGKPLLVSEFGGGGIYGMRSRFGIKWSEEMQRDLLDYTLSTYLNHPKVSGTIIWQFADCRVSDGKWSDVRPRTYNNKGIVDEYRRPKLSYDTVKRHYKTKV
jgi:beta-glucuronidase